MPDLRSVKKMDCKRIKLVVVEIVILSSKVDQRWNLHSSRDERKATNHTRLRQSSREKWSLFMGLSRIGCRNMHQKIFQGHDLGKEEWFHGREAGQVSNITFLAYHLAGWLRSIDWRIKGGRKGRREEELAWPKGGRIRRYNNGLGDPGEGRQNMLARLFLRLQVQR